MADLGGGVFVSRVDSDDFAPDADVGGYTMLLTTGGDEVAGMWKPETGHTYAGHVLPARETIVVVSGTVRIDVDAGPTLDLRAGDIASMPAGAVTTWYPSPDFREVWVYS